MSSSTDVRFHVERPEGQREDGRFDDVGAEGGWDIHMSGALTFYDGEGEAVIVYAPHAWSTVTPA